MVKEEEDISDVEAVSLGDSDVMTWFQQTGFSDFAPGVENTYLV
jgi:hypothetical protein